MYKKQTIYICDFISYLLEFLPMSLRAKSFYYLEINSQTILKNIDNNIKQITLTPEVELSSV